MSRRAIKDNNPAEVSPLHETQHTQSDESVNDLTTESWVEQVRSSSMTDESSARLTPSLTPECDSESLSSESMDSDLLTISDDTESLASLVTEDSLLTTLTPIVDRLVEVFYSWNSQSNVVQDGAEAVVSSSISPTVNRSSHRGLGKRKIAPLRRQDSNGDKSDNEDDESRRNSEKKPRVSGPDTSWSLPLACPFWKHNNVQHRKCHKLTLTRIRDVKQHLQRRHTPEFYCQRCYLIFDTEELQQTHILGVCERSTSAHLDGISSTADRALRKKSKPNLSTEDQWFAIWDIIFPNQRRPRSPYIDPHLSEDINLFREFWQNSDNVDDALANVLHEMRGEHTQSQISDEELQLLGQRIFVMGMDRVYDAWLSTHRVNSRSSHNSRGQAHLPAAGELIIPEVGLSETPRDINEAEADGGAMGSFEQEDLISSLDMDFLMEFDFSQ
ncbi:hypothetical protein B0H63DRAFT_480466 [Podospora didyma]|uniref:C2H2-type domain-containing protein n=1 Tax=Podospora didyma TaxID=330526 RepID=A0AAE0N922_9PEZI|nr:hypothetical protein B0H63DRAFT_480466 [Podospora didyma]